MNAETIKAMNKKETVFNRLAKWYRKNGYKINRVVLFPIWFAVCVKDKIHRYNYNKTAWSDERANEILSYYIPRVAKWDAEAKEFYFADNGMGWGMKCYIRKIKLKDRQFWKKYTGFWGGEIRTYLLNKFELKGFEKIIGNTYDCWAEITFTLKEGN